MQGAQGQGQGITALDVAATIGTLVGIYFFNPGAGWFDVGNTIAPFALMVTAPSFAQNQTVRQGLDACVLLGALYGFSQGAPKPAHQDAKP